MKIRNTATVPNIPIGMHLLEIESIDLVRQRSFDDPDVDEDRLKVGLRVLTTDVPTECFTAWMSPRCSEKAVFGSILAATLGETPNEAEVETDELIGLTFRAMVGRSDKGWPRLVAGTVSPAGVDVDRVPF